MSNNPEIDTLFSDWGDATPGCSAAAARDGELLYSAGFGMANLDHDVPITPATVFHVASVSKQFTAAAIVLLAEAGKLDLDDEVRAHIPEFPTFGHKITIRHLIHHTSGLRDQWDLLSLTGWRYSHDLITNDDVLALVSRQRDLNFPPGCEHLYSNTGYTLLAIIVERVSGQSFRLFTKEKIFEPLGMRATFFRDNFREVVPNQAYGYTTSDKDGAYNLSVTNFDTVGATSLVTTAEDLMKWAASYYQPRVGGDNFADQMSTQFELNDGTSIDYAFGITRGNYRGHDILTHGGGDAGYRSFFYVIPALRFSAAVLCNTVTDPAALAFQLADRLLPELEGGDTVIREEPTAEPAIEVSLKTLQDKEGQFWSEAADLYVGFAVIDGKLNVIFQGQNLALAPLSDLRFRVVASGTVIEFEEDLQALTTVLPGSPESTVFARIETFEPSPAELQDYAGEYRSFELEVVHRISVNEASLELKWLKSDTHTLKPLERDQFAGPGRLHFTRDAAGQVDGYLLSTGRIRNLALQKVTR